MENVLKHTKRYELVELNGSFLIFDKLYHEVKGCYKRLSNAENKYRRIAILGRAK